jgi:hypothetical protein
LRQKKVHRLAESCRLFLGDHVTTTINNREGGIRNASGSLMSMVWRYELVAGSVYDGGWAVDGG